MLFDKVRLCVTVGNIMTGNTGVALETGSEKPETAPSLNGLCATGILMRTECGEKRKRAHRTTPYGQRWMAGFVASLLAVSCAVQCAEASAIQAPMQNAMQATGTVPSAAAEKIVGTWQGTLTPPNASSGRRWVIKITKTENGEFKAALYNADQASPFAPFASVTQQGAAVTLSTTILTIAGRLSADGNTIDATWTSGGGAIPISFARATPDTAWPIPEAPKPMAADANPAIDVATIKPNNSGATGMQRLTFGGRTYVIRAASLEELICIAYGVQAKQIVGAPGWVNSDRFDIDAVPDTEGIPNLHQTQVMIQKLMAERFNLAVHHDQREMPAYVLEASKSGPKMTPNESKWPSPGFGYGPGGGGIALRATNAAMGEFAGYLQVAFLDRPVVDRTGLTGRYDFKCTFTLNDAQVNGPPARSSAPTAADGAQGVTADDVVAAPSLYEAMEQQLGLKLTAEKTNVDVIVIDHVEEPSPN
jgi:uncharacterized protein (TIGR03435 family)